MPVYYEVINGTIYVCNRRGNVRTPLGEVNQFGHSSGALQAVCDSLNAAYKAGYQTSLNQLRARIDQMEVTHNETDKRLS